MISRLDDLMKKDEGYWMDILRKWIVEQPMVEVQARPSLQKGEELMAEEKARVEAQKQQLGEVRPSG